MSNFRLYRSKGLLVGVSAVALLIAGAAQAQDAPASDDVTEKTTAKSVTAASRIANDIVQLSCA